MASSIPPPEHFDTTVMIAAGECPPLGVRITALVTGKADFEWIVFRSDAATIRIAEIELEHPAGTGRFCSLGQCVEEMRDNVAIGLSMMGSGPARVKAAEVMSKFDDMVDGTLPFHIEIDDPVGVSYLHGPAKAERVEYKRTWEQVQYFDLRIC
jgi:C4-type Zn-finger protein